MRGILLALFCLSAGSACAFGRLVQPDGSVVALGEVHSTGALTLLFPPRAITEASWILMPPGAVISEVELEAEGQRRVVDFPVVRIPGLRFAVEVPKHLLSLTLRGRYSEDLSLNRSLSLPAGQPWAARSARELRVDLPALKIAAGWTPFVELTRPVETPWQVELSRGETSIGFSMLAAVRRWDYAPAAWGFMPSRLVVRGADPRLTEVRINAVGAEDNLPADPATLLAWSPEQWRNPHREWFRWNGTSVLVLVTADYTTQDAYLKRLAFYVEKTGFRGRVVSDAEMGALHGWNAHDYASPDLARFFTQAAQENFALNRAELELRARLEAAGILVPEGPKAWKAGTGALVGISAESAPGLRRVLFVHEAFHGLYFTTPEFRAGVRQAWDGLSEDSRNAFRSFLSLSRYDPSDEALMVNEFQAYVLQRSTGDWDGFFRQVLSPLTPAQRLTSTLDFLEAAHKLNGLVQGLFGFPSGNVSLVTTF